MPPRRVRPPTRPLTIDFDGRSIEADAEASIASALVAIDEWLLARSPKFHRPRGASCMRGGCDGCLMRVDDAPNVMVCGVPAHAGARVRRQNVALSPKLDVLRAADWFFPQGMNHHEMFAGVPGVSQVMQAFARRISGLGELPTAPSDHAPPVFRVMTDVLVVGAGPAGLAASAAIARKGLKVTLIDDRIAPGGSLACFPPAAVAVLGGREVDVDAELSRRLEEVDRAGVDRRTRTTVVGVLEGNDWLADAPDGLLRIEARAHVVAAGGHDGVAAFGNNDLPGVLSARAAGRLLREGVLVGETPLVVGDGPHARAFAEAAVRAGAVPIVVPDLAHLVSVRGMSRVKGADLSIENQSKKVSCDCVVVDAPVAPSFELFREAGGAVIDIDAGFAARVDGQHRAIGHPSSDGEPTIGGPLFALGEATASSLDLGAFDAAAAQIADQLSKELR